MQNINKNFLLLFISLFIAISYLILHSSTNPLIMGRADSSVFLTVGFSWAENLIPYRDIFDHKGPVLYLLNALGFLICNEFYGVLLIEAIFLSINIILFFLLCDKNKYSFILSLIFIAFYFNKVFEDGNLTEEYAITFNLIAIFIFTKQYPIRFYSYGFLGGLLFLLRPNLAAPTLAVFFIDFLRSRHYKPVTNILKCAIGFTAVLLPTAVYFYLEKSLTDFINCFLIFNVKYAGISKQNFLYVEMLHIIKNAYIYIPLTIIYVLIAKKNFSLFIENLAIFIFSLLMTAISGRSYLHYFMLTIPSILLTIATYIKLYNTDTLVIEAVNKYKEQLYALKQNIFSSPKILVLLCCLVIASGVYYVFSIYTTLNTTKLENIRNFFYQNGITQESSILNLANHTATKIFYILKIPPREKDFFPETASITGKYTELLKQDTLLCPKEEYDLVIIPQDKKFQCPQYSRFDTPLSDLMIYKRNAQ